MLAIATPDIDTPAETYIRQHLDLIAPEKTCLIYFKGDNRYATNIPALKVSNKKNGLASKLASFKNLIKHGYSGTITGERQRELVTFLRQHSVTALFAEFGQTGCAMQAVCHDMGIPLFTYFHGYDATVAPRKRKYRRAYRSLGKSAHTIFVTSRYLRKRVIEAGIPASKIEVIPCGIQTENFTPQLHTPGPMLLACGRMVEKKAPHLTIQAFHKVIQQIPEATLEMIGDGPLLDKAKQAAHDLGITNSVIFHGRQENTFVRDKLQHASVFVQHSVTASNGDTESLGVSLLEAMACGVPVVATQHNGFPDTVAHGETGYLVPEYDTDAMAERIIEILKDHKLKEKLSHLARTHVVSKFDASDLCKKLKTRMQIS